MTKTLSFTSQPATDRQRYRGSADFATSDSCLAELRELVSRLAIAQIATAWQTLRTIRILTITRQ